MNPKWLMEGFIPGSKSFRLGIALMTSGLENAISTDEAVCIPSVPSKVSIENPSKKEEVNKSHPGVSNGNNKIK